VLGAIQAIRLRRESYGEMIGVVEFEELALQCGAENVFFPTAVALPGDGWFGPSLLHK
jgi:hypothetical protein